MIQRNNLVPLVIGSIVLALVSGPHSAALSDRGGSVETSDGDPPNGAATEQEESGDGDRATLPVSEIQPIVIDPAKIEAAYPECVGLSSDQDSAIQECAPVAIQVVYKDELDQLRNLGIPAKEIGTAYARVSGGVLEQLSALGVAWSALDPREAGPESLGSVRTELVPPAGLEVTTTVAHPFSIVDVYFGQQGTCPTPETADRCAPRTGSFKVVVEIQNDSFFFPQILDNLRTNQSIKD